MRQLDGAEALERVRQLRHNATEAEKKLWQALRGRRLANAKLRRQAWIGPYIADFLCLEAALVVELDGSQHVEQTEYDANRSTYLEGKGLRVLRVWNNDVERNIKAVLSGIFDAICVPSPSHRPGDGGPLPLPGGEG